MYEYKLKNLCPSKLQLTVQIRRTPYYQVIHTHDALELVYIRHGSGWCAVDGILHPMTTGDLYVIPVGASHEYSGDLELSYINCLFNQKIFLPEESELYRYFCSGTPNHLAVKYTFGPGLREKLELLLEELHKELHSSSAGHLALSRALFIQMVVFIIRNASSAPGVQATASQQQLGRVLCYIADHLNEKIPLEKLAKIAGYTPRYLTKCFRKGLGCGIAKYIQNRRLESAAFSLKNSPDAVEAIAYANGFPDASYFVKVFRNRFGLTPAKFRQKR